MTRRGTIDDTEQGYVTRLTTDIHLKGSPTDKRFGHLLHAPGRLHDPHPVQRRHAIHGVHSIHGGPASQRAERPQRYRRMRCQGYHTHPGPGPGLLRG